MARYSQPTFDFYQQSPETKPAFSEDDEMSVLDDKILDSTTSPEISSSDRRTSYDNLTDPFTHHPSHHHPPPSHPHPHHHREPVWPDFAQPVTGLSSSRHPSAVSSSSHHPHHQAMLESTAHPFTMRVDGPQHPAAAYGQSSTAAWSSLARDSSSCTPTGVMYDHFSPELDQHSANAPFSGGAVGPVSALQLSHMSYRPGMPSYTAPGAVAMSPQSSQGWMPASTDLADGVGRPTKSPSYRNSSPLSLRRDGIRKKNARFEIPAERTLSNIDQLINQSTNEEEIKELKQQKRLLRNRQAALDSRQRKKLHTEKLEEEKKQFTQIINGLEEDLRNMQVRETELLREKNEWMGTQQQINQYLENLHMEKDEMIRVHTLETLELRKKNTALMEMVEKLEQQVKAGPVQPPTAAPPNSFSNEFSDLEGLNMDGGWEELTLVNNLSLDADPMPAAASQQASVNDKVAAAADSPFSWNAFYMCLLFGAFIASHNGPLSSRSIPQLSEEYRAESANVLKAVLASSPAELTQTSSNPSLMSASAGAGAGAPAMLPTTISGAEMAQMTAGAAVSNLDDLHHRLAMPTKEQEQQQLFALTAEQYNSLTTFESGDNGASDFKPQPPSNLQQAWANMRSNTAQCRQLAKSISGVHSRSLMWDRVPEKVIQDFRRMVQEYGPVSVKEEDGPSFRQP
ncbi:hypothetical protein ASPZODRAFT_66999 [Penicilliopsis zonata CBS 506.65]|uniref:BZIP domain-containing protein n=1 Tax=Penicilliopsis zonata CBS 506.65 TaxID=1073090 RepID=A0A1L9SFV6_9EURO|nr:hypothetical protein ASPZODRAFT_66999 [Penicilliopsis zonata CBS 506.65]OJJ46120.1 hypothetical protein ASPZODRAFT_66999 [Penicilliopsis zonata CBS 506.65]